MTLTAGLDVGTGSVKIVIFDVQGDDTKCLGKRTERIRQRDPFKLAEETFDGLLGEAGLERGDLAYVASTGEAETLSFTTGHFYSMTTHARGGIFLQPEARSILDIGALHGRAVNIDERGKVLGYKMTSQCASGSGQFLENIARYLGISQDEIGPLSKTADNPEKVSGICAVLAETDVINMVSRQISAANILRGIHESMADRLVKLLRATKVTEGLVLLTGGLASDEGLLLAIEATISGQNMKVTAKNHPDSIYAGAMGAAIWGAFRHEKLARLGQLSLAS